MGQDLASIPGVRKGFIPTIAHEDAPPQILYRVGDKVLHKKFGEGRVQDMTGTGSEARIVIQFTAYGEKQFALSVAPIVKLE
jgi:hypothetical protein